MIKLAVAAVAAIGVGALTPAPATAAPISSCTSTTGTIIAVDFSHWGGPIVRGCDTGNPVNGAHLLTDEGFTTAGDAHDGPQFLCRIGNQAYNGGTQYPTAAEDKCINTPPASAYWSYWLAPAGQNTWTYSQLGAYSEKPKKGEVELWIFGGTNIAGTQGLPTCSPASLRTSGSAAHCSSVGSAGVTSGHPRSKPKSTQHATSRHPKAAGSVRTSATNPVGPTRTRATTSATAGASSPANSVAPSHPRSPSRPGSASATPTSAAAAGSGSPSASGLQIIDARPAAANTASHGSAVPLVIGVGLAAILAAGGGVTMWRRRQQSE